MTVRSGAIRHFAKIKNGSTPASGEPSFWDGDIAWATPDDLGRLDGKFISKTKRNITPLAVAENNLNVVPPGTVLLSTRAPIGHMAINTSPMAFNQGCRALIPQPETHGPFLFYLLESRIPELNASANGTTFVELSRDDLACVRISLPSLDTQKRIAAFLDEKTKRIDALIANKRALLERLTEKRHAIITHAVTKGLSPAVPMMNSGIDWLGEIPAHWKVKRLKYLTRAPLKYGANASAEWNEPDWPRFIRITDVDQSGNLRPDTFRSLPPEVAEPYLLAEGDILLARSGATVGKSFIYRKDWGAACFAGYLILARIGRHHSADFIYQYLNSDAFWSWAGASLIQSTIQNISAERYANLWVPCPPLSEQIAIADAVSLLRSQIADRERKVEQSLNMLNEYRSSLVTAAVTGQLEGLR